MPLLDAALELSTPFQHRDVAVILHAMVRAIAPRNSPDGLIILPHESLPLNPSEEARPVHRRIGEPPQGVILVSNEVRRRNHVVTFIQHDTADGALSFAGKD